MLLSGAGPSLVLRPRPLAGRYYWSFPLFLYSAECWQHVNIFCSECWCTVSCRKIAEAAFCRMLLSSVVLLHFFFVWGVFILLVPFPLFRWSSTCARPNLNHLWCLWSPLWSRGWGRPGRTPNSCQAKMRKDLQGHSRSENIDLRTQRFSIWFTPSVPPCVPSHLVAVLISSPGVSCSISALVSRLLQEEDFHEMVRTSEVMENQYGHLFDAVIVNEELSAASSELRRMLRTLETESHWLPVSWTHSWQWRKDRNIQVLYLSVAGDGAGGSGDKKQDGATWLSRDMVFFSGWGWTRGFCSGLWAPPQDWKTRIFAGCGHRSGFQSGSQPGRG